MSEFEKDRIIPQRHRFVMNGQTEPALDTRTTGDKLAAQHVDWFLQTVRPLMIAEFLHGYKHGRDDERESADGK